jgi:hypothetical protein
MEAARQADEQQELKTSSSREPAANDNAEVTLDSLPDMFGVASKPSTEPPAADPGAISNQGKTTVERAPTLPQTEEQPNQVDEVVLCSPQGDVIYEWQSVDTEKRIAFLEFLSRKAQQMGSTLNFGKFDRLEVLTAKSKIVAQLQPDCGVFIRTSKEAVDGGGVPGLRMAS